MVVLNKIYTRTGDAGTTALGTGARVAKHNARVEAYGAVDEANAVLGLVRLHTGSADLGDLDAMLARIQNDLFDLGADLCTPDTGEKPEFEPLRITADQVTRLETGIDALNDVLDPLRSFVLPAGAPAAALPDPPMWSRSFNPTPTGCPKPISPNSLSMPSPAPY